MRWKETLVQALVVGSLPRLGGKEDTPLYSSHEVEERWRGTLIAEFNMTDCQWLDLSVKCRISAAYYFTITDQRDNYVRR